MEQRMREMELRSKLAMEEPIYDDSGNIVGLSPWRIRSPKAEFTEGFAVDHRAIIH